MKRFFVIVMVSLFMSAVCAPVFTVSAQEPQKKEAACNKKEADKKCDKPCDKKADDAKCSADKKNAGKKDAGKKDAGKDAKKVEKKKK